MQAYKDASGIFGSSTAIAMRMEMAPAVKKSFCSLTCRNMEIMSDEGLEKSSTLSKKCP
ncbi:unnamed protein product [Lupinus luteus]|uniref:Uncharacterized protein n=1 Tax=Lupinus luteus TaxID=3873 RepID=A0AAV1YG65_LUPLU